MSCISVANPVYLYYIASTKLSFSEDDAVQQVYEAFYIGHVLTLFL
jgi:hypothetical protein